MKENDAMKQPAQPERPSSSYRPVPSWFLGIVALPVLIGLLWFGRDFLIPIAVAALIFILNMALIDRLGSLTIAGRSVPQWLAYLIATSFMFLVVFGIGYVVSSQSVAISEAAPRYLDRLAGLKVDIENFLGAERLSVLERAIAEYDVSKWLADFATSAGGVIGSVGLVLLYLAFMLAERSTFAEKIPRLCATQEDAKRLADVLNSISIGVRQYMWINTVTSAMSGVWAYVVLKVLGVDFAATLALFVFMVNFVPSVGSFLGVLLPTLVALLQFDTVTPALLVVLVYGGGDAIIGNVVEPRLQGKSLNLSALVVMLALTFWGTMWGGVGAFMAVPLTVVIVIVCSQFPELQFVARLFSSNGVLPGSEEDNVTPAAEEGADPLGKP